ncbi:hypothetical protein Cgig2_019713 [Carnegiea gigantea]|uniref:Uncharacterized protein n=1 Tax=Carnegiea gigantea TaxID=171969 RepID=A0A9Q1KP94_9CARY|nr:hypothetical protein Cgig2_019713 [Carnegiea gigantea]
MEEREDPWTAPDKVYHVLFCFSLTVIFSLLAGLAPHPFLRRRRLLIAAFLSLSAGAAKEFADHLGFFQSSGASARDAVADAVGVCLALPFSKFMLPRYKPDLGDQARGIALLKIAVLKRSESLGTDRTKGDIGIPCYENVEDDGRPYCDPYRFSYLHDMYTNVGFLLFAVTVPFLLKKIMKGNMDNQKKQRGRLMLTAPVPVATAVTTNMRLKIWFLTWAHGKCFSAAKAMVRHGFRWAPEL